MANNDVMILQLLMKAVDIDSGPIDGIKGPKTIEGIETLLARVGYSPTKNTDLDKRVPWLVSLSAMMGKHEVRDKEDIIVYLTKAYKYMVSNKKIDPEKYPWCGIAVGAALMDSGIRNIPLDGEASIAWRRWGETLINPIVGAILVFWRGNPKSYKGHVGFYIGEDANYYHVLGGNQRNSVCVSKIKKSRLRANGIRWPAGVRKNFLDDGKSYYKEESNITITNNEL